jgi:hypothetical protein
MLLAAPPAVTAVATGDRREAPELDRAPELRNGIVLGVSLGAGLSTSSGYPNDSQQIGDARYHSSSGWLPGTSRTLHVMGALTDYLNFGFWLATASFGSNNQHATRVGAGLRVETFPLIVLLPSLKGLGVFSQFGLGTGRLTTRTSGVPDAVGTQSFLGVGAFYEWSLAHVLGGHFGVGPSLEYDAVWSLPFDQHGLLASARLVFYGGP